MKLWLLADGSYSEYRVIGVFDDEHVREAEKFAGASSAYVEGPIELNQLPEHGLIKGRKYWHVEMCKDGSVSWCKRLPELDESYEERENEYHLHSPLVCPCCKFERKSYWRLWVMMYAKSKEHIVKVANEIRVQILAGAKPPKGEL